MAASMLFRTTYKLGSLVGKSSGEVFELALWQVFYAACVIGGALFAMRWNILGVACTTSISVFLQFLAMSKLGMQATKLAACDIARVHVEPLIYALIVGGVAWAIAFTLHEAGAKFPLVAAATTAGGTLVFFVLARAGMRRGGGDWPWLRETLVSFIKRRKPAPPATPTSPPAPDAPGPSPRDPDSP